MVGRRAGQGMTEYVVVVGLVAVLLAGAVRGFGKQLDITIQGTTGVEDVRDRMSIDDPYRPEDEAPLEPPAPPATEAPGFDAPLGDDIK